jgi:predicted NAD/FAD-binding protein/CRP-like cAMP-binding protein
MGAAYSLVKAGLNVTLFESKPRLGGHCFGVAVPLATGKSIHIDAGVSDFNQATFVTVGTLLNELGVEYYAVSQDASFMTPDREAVWYSRSGKPTFLREPNDRRRLLEEVKRFNTACIEVLSDITYTEWTTKKYLDARGYSDEFRTLYFNPRAQGCFPMPDRPPEDYLIRSLVAFWRMHGIVGPGPAARMVVKGGMHAYCTAFEAWVRSRGATLHLATRVVGIARRKNRVRIRAMDAAQTNLTFEFDHVAIAANANDVAPLLEDATREEARIYAGFGWQRSRLVVHQDERLMPRDRTVWGAYNYLIADSESPEIRPTITFYPNLLASLDKGVPDIFVTMNPYREPAAEKIISNQFFIHPAVDGITDMACERLDAIQGRRGTWFCGSYLREPFVHEQAMRCGVDLGERVVEAVRQGTSAEAPLGMSAGQFDDFLREIPLFTGLDTLALTEVQLMAQPFFAKTAETLFRQGDLATGMYLLKDGEVRITRRLPGDDVMELARLGRGSLIGELGLLDRGRRSGTATATRASSGYFISFESFQLLRANCGRAAFVVINRFVNEVVHRTRNRLAEVMRLIEATPEVASGTRAPVEAASPPVLCESLPSFEVLARIPFFSRLSAEDLRQFTASLKLRALPRNSVLFRKGDPPGECLIVVRGALTLNVESGDRFLQFSVLGPGRVAGELALLDAQPQPLDCRTREDSLVLAMDRERFEVLRQGGGPAAFKFFEAVASGAVALLRKADGHVGWLRPDKPFEAQQAIGDFKVPVENRS